MAGNDENQGLSEAHTPPENSAAPRLDIDPDRAAKVGSTRAITEAAMAGLAQQIAPDEPEAEQPSLLFDHDETGCLFAGPVKHVADLRNAAKRGRGRPQGSQNKRSDNLATYLLTLGYRDPALILADIANADPTELAEELSEPYRPKSGPHKGQLIEGSVTPDMALKLIKDAAAELMPYFHAKRPQQIEVSKQVMGVMIVGNMPTEQTEETKTISLTRFDPPE